MFIVGLLAIVVGLSMMYLLYSDLPYMQKMQCLLLQWLLYGFKRARKPLAMCTRYPRRFVH